MKVNKVIPFPRQQVIDVVKSFDFIDRDIPGPVQYIKETERGRIHIILDAQQKRETRIRIHQDVVFSSTMGKTYHFTEDGDATPLDTFNKIEAELYRRKMEEHYEKTEQDIGTNCVQENDGNKAK